MLPPKKRSRGVKSFFIDDILASNAAAAAEHRAACKDGSALDSLISMTRDTLQELDRAAERDASECQERRNGGGGEEEGKRGEFEEKENKEKEGEWKGKRKERKGVLLRHKKRERYRTCRGEREYLMGIGFCIIRGLRGNLIRI